MPNWKEPRPDLVQGFWLKNFKSVQEGLKRNLQKCLENEMMMSMTKGRRVQRKERQRKGQGSK